MKQMTASIDSPQRATFWTCYLHGKRKNSATLPLNKAILLITNITQLPIYKRGVSIHLLIA